ncbi:Permease of the major facilitator superfamily [Nitrincola lacisaponensis]|uniref:Permease of the major facilitator superfamily n=1 Tax=Nitrincola lacisaponensis TaxID=267850 RepID=A0A063Y8H5_9GAMM|nr:MFS transporter [Nitrincola lacisaponensis]KDE41026.1 Permease of the major facilitator superfamily [Nitrincola lacisaponensis]
MPTAAPSTPPAQLAPKREIFGWAMFDFANQAYTLLIITVIYGDLFTRVIVGDAPDYRLGNLLWSLALAVSYLMVVVANPVCGAIMDYTASRKRFLWVSYWLTIVTTALLYFVEPGWLIPAMLLIILSNFAYAIGEGFVASFLPDLGPRKTLGWISGLGWGMGYIGGLVATAFTLFFLGEVSAENFDTIRWVGPFAAGFFLIAAIPTFVWLRERGQSKRQPSDSSLLQLGVARVVSTWHEIQYFRDLRSLLISVFFAMAGVYIIIAFSFIYGAQVIGWDDQVRALMFITVQITAALGAVGFGWLQSQIGTRTTYIMTLCLWLLAILAIWQTPSLTELLQQTFGLQWQAQHVFLFAGVLAGLSLGSSQSAGRALVGVLTPLGKSAEFFGFWGMSAKLAAVFGILGLGLIQWAFGLADAILFCLVLFVLAIVTVLPVNERRGEQAADDWTSVPQK